ncbi:MAG TPA: LamG domain-containing protein [Clostridia bacterium]|nr:LamG domain-containing protein [Clostridia bacterium]
MKPPQIPVLALTISALLQTQPLLSQPVVHWNFDQNDSGQLIETIGSRRTELKGNASFVEGVQGKCLILDGLTTFAVLEATNQPKFNGGFTVEAWIALGAYPLAKAPIVDLHNTNNSGFFLGINAHGRPELGVGTGSRWQALAAPERVPLRQWHHLAAVFEPTVGMSLYLDGKQVANQEVEGTYIPAEGLDLLVGRHRFKQKPEGPVRRDSTGVVYDYLDGTLDELNIHSRALSAEDISQVFQTTKVPAEVPLPPRVLPSGPSGPGPFGAFYTHLQFYPQWDQPWRVSDYPDVVVRFDQAPIRFVFWRGTSYIPNWVTENGIWYNNEFNETWTGVQGCGEPMSDKQCRFSNVRVIESSEARAVVHWRYALVDVFYTHARVDPLTGWGDWSDEVYTIYPHGTSVREITLHSTNPEQPHEWQESIVVMGPGFSPENSIDPAGVTLVDATGETVTYSWKDSTPPAKPGKPAHPCIQVINTKSRFKPFAILRPQDNPDFDVYAGEIRRDVTIYPWWNHWPAATYPSDGRYALAADRTSHSSLTHLFWDPYQQGHHWMRKIMLAGMTDQPASSLLSLMRSWSKPAELKLVGDAFQSESYDQAQKAYVLKRKQATASTPLKFELAASPESPIVNPAFVIKNWGEAGAELTLNGKKVPRGSRFRFGQRASLEGTDLVAWLKTESNSPLRITIQPK